MLLVLLLAVPTAALLAFSLGEGARAGPVTSAAAPPTSQDAAPRSPALLGPMSSLPTPGAGRSPLSWRTPSITVTNQVCTGTVSSSSLVTTSVPVSAGGAIYATSWIFASGATPSIDYAAGSYHGTMTLLASSSSGGATEAFFETDDLPASSGVVLTENLTAPASMDLAAAMLAPVSSGDSVRYDATGPGGSTTRTQMWASVGTSRVPEWVGMGYSDNDGSANVAVGTGETVVNDCNLPTTSEYVGIVDRSQPVTFVGTVTVIANISNYGGPLASSFYELPAGGTLTLTSFSANPSSLPAGNPTTLRVTATGGAPPYAYAYAGLPPGCTSSNTANLACTPSSPGTYTPRVWVNDSLLASVTSTTSLTVSAPLALTASSLQTPTDAGTSVAFQGTATGGLSPYAWTWRWGDGGAAFVQAPSHTFLLAGTYTVWVWVNDSYGSTATTTVVEAVNPPPSVAASASPNPATVGTLVSFGSTLSGGTAPIGLVWRFGDGGSGSGASPTHTYNAAGSFVAWVWANDSVGRSVANYVVVTVTTSGGGCTNPTLLAVSVQPTSVTLGYRTAQTFVATSHDSCGNSPAVGVAYAWKLSPAGGLGSLNASVGDPVVLTTGSSSATGNLCVNATAAATTLESCGSIVVASSGGAGAPVVLAFHAYPSSIQLGATTVLVVNAQGGTPPLRYYFTGLPSGCASADTDQLNCTPTVTGNFTISVLVVDQNGLTGIGTTTLLVTSPPPAGPSPTAAGGLPSWWIYAVVLLVVVVAAAGAVLLLRRRRAPPPAAMLAPSDGGPDPGAWAAPSDPSGYPPPGPALEDVPAGPPPGYPAAPAGPGGPQGWPPPPP